MSILNYESWISLKESQDSLEESKISKSVRSVLGDFFRDHGKEASFEKAKEHVSSKIQGWDLTTEDFEELRKSNISEEDSYIIEGKMKDIEIISQESESKEDFERNLKDHFRKIGKADLADDKDFIATYVETWEPRETNS